MSKFMLLFIKINNSNCKDVLRLKKKKILKIVVILLFIVILLVGIAFLVNRKLDNSNLDNSNIEKLREYSETLTEFNCQNAISDKGYINEDEALKVIATSTVNRNNKHIQMKEYLKGVDSIKIELIENNENENNNSVSGITLGDVKSQGTYWKIILKHNSPSYMEKAQFNVNYYTGEILFGEVTSQLNID